MTGSNAQMLSKDIATTLGGRFIIKEVFPFSFYEYLQFKGVELLRNWEYGPVKNVVVKSFEDYFYNGGFPECFELNDKRSWLNSLYQKILMGDIVARNAIRNPDAIRLLAKKMAESVMQPTTQTRLQNIVSSAGAKVGRATIIDYIGQIKDAYLVFGISNYTDSISERESSQKRYYHDNGILNIFLTDAVSKLLENLVAITLMQRYGIEDVYYYNKNVEVDFYMPRQKIAIQASYSIADDATFERETKALLKINAAFDIDKLIIITYDEECEVEIDGVMFQVIPIWKWLLLGH